MVMLLVDPTCDLLPEDIVTDLQGAEGRKVVDDDIRKDILEAGDIISTEEAERRVLILENPGLPGTSRITRSLYAGMQLILIDIS